ncbi:MAG: ABC transporter permease [Candidatus Heimdallarchaeaceae archaeon]
MSSQKSLVKVTLTKKAQHASEIFNVTFRHVLRKKSVIIIELVLFLPIVIPIHYLLQKARGMSILWDDPDNSALVFFMNNIYAIYLSLLIPMVITVLTATAVLEEQKEQTIVYLLTRPLKRYWIVIQKFLALFPIVILLSLPPLFVNFAFYVGMDIQLKFVTELDKFWNLFVGVVWYSFFIVAICIFFCLISKRAIVFSMAYILGYELLGYQVIVGFFANIRYIFASFYVQSYLARTIADYQLSPLTIIDECVHVWTAIFVLFITSIMWLILSYVVLDHKEYYGKEK